jgi:hypothetical protein
VRYNGKMKRYTMTGVVTNMPSSRYTTCPPPDTPGRKGDVLVGEDRDEMQNQIEKNNGVVLPKYMSSICTVLYT